MELKVIVYVWVNDEKNKCVYGSKIDVYKVFEKMLKIGYLFDGWDDFLKVVKDELFFL